MKPLSLSLALLLLAGSCAQNRAADTGTLHRPQAILTNPMCHVLCFSDVRPHRERDHDGEPPVSSRGARH